MNMVELQRYLKGSGRYRGEIDGRFGPATKGAVMQALTDGPDTLLTEADFVDSAARLDVQVAAIKAVTKVESSGAGFSAGRPVLLFEPHRFSRATAHRFDVVAADVSYPTWDRTKYPKTQGERYEQLLKAVGLDVDAGFASASYGRFQILGENYLACGYSSPFDFAIAQAYDERNQLLSFEQFVLSRHLDVNLRAGDWAGFAAKYNGTSYALNAYDKKLRDAFIAAGGH